MRHLTTKEIQKRNQERKAELVKKAQEKGVIEIAAKYLSAMYLLHSHSAVIYAELEELLQENKLEQFGKQFNKFAGLPTQERDTNNEEKEAQDDEA